MIRMAALVLLATLSPLTNSSPLAAREVAGPAEVIDGDTLRVGAETIRLEGIDAPEIGQSCRDAAGKAWACGRAARDRLAALIKGRAVACHGAVVDPYHRLVATCRVDGRDIDRVMVEEGLAWAFRRYSTTYASSEDAARAARIGIWSGTAEPAWDYRAHRWAEAAGSAPRGCPIKGNITAKGEQIYHPPWSPWYAKTRVDESKGERWFCDEAEAIAAGFRAPNWVKGS
jgi:endonuclease YncB( thermonuclease family)